MYILDTVESVVPVDNTVTGVSYTYLTIKKNTGRITHHFLVDASYRFDLRKKKSSGKWYFYCSVPGCTASLKAQYIDDTEEPEFLSCDTVHNLKGGGSHEPNEVTRLVESTRWLIKEGIEANLHKPIIIIKSETPIIFINRWFLCSTLSFLKVVLLFYLYISFFVISD